MQLILPADARPADPASGSLRARARARALPLPRARPVFPPSPRFLLRAGRRGGASRGRRRGPAARPGGRRGLRGPLGRLRRHLRAAFCAGGEDAGLVPMLEMRHAEEGPRGTSRSAALRFGGKRARAARARPRQRAASGAMRAWWQHRRWYERCADPLARDDQPPLRHHHHLPPTPLPLFPVRSAHSRTSRCARGRGVPVPRRRGRSPGGPRQRGGWRAKSHRRAGSRVRAAHLCAARSSHRRRRTMSCRRRSRRR